jgi:hypothetical protein
MREKETQITLVDVQRAFEIETIDYKARVMQNIIQPLFSLLLDAHKRIGELEAEVKILKNQEDVPGDNEEQKETGDR